MVLQGRMPISNYRKYTPKPVPTKKEVIRVRSRRPVNRDRGECLSPGSSAVDVIDLGAPRDLRRVSPAPLPAQAPRAPYTPNPRLYPGPAAKPKARRRRKRKAGGGRRALPLRPVPNARLYRPAPRRAPPAPVPRAAWTPPPSAARTLDTASRAALRLAGRAPPPSPRVVPQSTPVHAPAPAPAATSEHARRLVVTLPAAAMEAGARHSTSPDDCSDAADASSAPSEFLAEFLSAIMRRQYAEALKFCRLILQYEPHNATARGFYPLLRHKVRAHEGGGSSPSRSGSSAAPHSRSSSRTRSHSRSHSRDHSHSHSRSRHGGQWSLSLSGGASGGGGCGGGGGGGAWSAGSEAGGSASSQSSLEDDDATDDNGNHTHTRQHNTDDLENDNDVSSFKSETASLRRLRAQFACSIK